MGNTHIQKTCVGGSKLTFNPDAFRDDFVLELSLSIAKLRHDGRITLPDFKTINNILYEVKNNGS